MTLYEIHWNDLTEEAKVKLKGLYHDNVELTPLTIIEVEDFKGPDLSCWVCGLELNYLGHSKWTCPDKGCDSHEADDL